MPQAIGFAILALLPQSFAAGLWTTFGISIFTTATVIGNVALTAALIGLQYAIAPRPDLPKPSDGTQTLRQTISPRIGGYGRCRIAGAYMLYESHAGFSYDVIALVSGKISGIARYYLHDDEVTVDGDGEVTAVDETDGRYSLGWVLIETSLGSDPGTAYADVIAGLPVGTWTADHRGDGIASASLICQQVKADDFLTVFPHGLPQFSAALDLYALWDFRDTNQDPDDPATWINYSAYNPATTYAVGDRVLYNGVVYISAIGSNTGNTPDADAGKWVSVWENPVLQIVDYLTHTADPYRFSMGKDRDRLITPVLANLIAEANKCDVLVARKSGLSEPKYRSNGWFRFDNNQEDVLGAILATCDGWMIEDIDGTLALRVGAYSAPTKTITEKHILGFEVDYGSPAEEQINEIVFSFTSPAHKYREEPGDPWRNEDAISEVGKVRSRPLPLTWVQSHSQGRRLSKRAATRLNAPMRGNLVTTLYGLYVWGDRWVNLQYPLIPGLEDAVVELSGGSIDFKTGRISYQWLKIDPATIDAWNHTDEEGTAPPTPDELARDTLPVPDNLVVTVEGDVENGVYADVEFDDPERPDLGYVIQYRIAGSPPGNWVPHLTTTYTVAGGRITLRTPVLQTNVVYDVRVASMGSVFSFSEFSDIVQADTTDVAPSTPTNLNAVNDTGTVTISWTNPNSANMHRARIYRGATFGASVQITNSPVFGGANQAMQTTDAPGAGSHNYWVTAENVGGNASSPAGPANVNV